MMANGGKVVSVSACDCMPPGPNQLTELTLKHKVDLS